MTDENALDYYGLVRLAGGEWQARCGEPDCDWVSDAYAFRGNAVTAIDDHEAAHEWDARDVVDQTGAIKLRLDALLANAALTHWQFDERTEDARGTQPPYWVLARTDRPDLPETVLTTPEMLVFLDGYGLGLWAAGRIFPDVFADTMPGAVPPAESSAE